jgi:hypothetical protein
MDEKKQALESSLESIVKELILEHRVSHAQVTSVVHKAVMSLADGKPCIRVLYNVIHGGFSYSKGFEEFTSKHGRVSAVPFIKEFGAHCRKLYPHVARMLDTYTSNNLNHMFNLVASIIDAKASIKRLEDRENILANTADEGTEKLKDEGGSYNVMYGDFDKLCKQYTYTSLQNSITRVRNKLQGGLDKTVQDLVQCIASSCCILSAEECMQALIDNHDFKFDEEIAEAEKPYYARQNWAEVIDGSKGIIRLSFWDAAGLVRWAGALWKCQTSYKYCVMKFLLRFPDVFKVPPTFDPETINEKLGLLFASGEYASLDIAEVPAYVEWTINEYDGKEQVVY